MLKTHVLVGAAVVFSCLWAARAPGQENIEFITAVPESPAFIFLGASPTKVTRPGAVRDFGAALLAGVNAEGKAENGFALEATAIDIVPGFNLTLEQYRRWENFVAANAQLSIGTARSAGDSASTDLAAGRRLTLLDQGDPLLDQAFTGPVGNSLGECNKKGDPNLLPDTLTEEELAKAIQEQQTAIVTCSDSVMEAAFEEWTREHWNARRLAFGAAAGTRLVESSLDDTKGLGAQFWLVGANPLGRSGQAIGQLTYRHDMPVGDSADQSLFSYGLRVVFGSASFNGFGEVVGENPFGGDSESRTLWSGGIEFRIGENLWLSTGLGSRYSELTKDTKSVVLANVRWGVASAARFAVVPAIDPPAAPPRVPAPPAVAPAP